MFAIITPKRCLIDELKTSTKWMDIKKSTKKKRKKKKEVWNPNEGHFNFQSIMAYKFLAQSTKIYHVNFGFDR